jgi:hypothetical protein
VCEAEFTASVLPSTPLVAGSSGITATG